MTLLLVILALLGGYVLGVWCTVVSIEKHYPATWKIYIQEIEANKQKRADAAREKGA